MTNLTLDNPTTIDIIEHYQRVINKYVKASAAGKEKSLIILCPEKHLADQLFFFFNLVGNYQWFSGDNCEPSTSGWEVHKENTCYILNRSFITDKVILTRCGSYYVDELIERYLKSHQYTVLDARAFVFHANAL